MSTQGSKSTDSVPTPYCDGVTHIGYDLRPATATDFEALFGVHVASLRESVEATWGWDEALQRRIFTERFDPATSQVIDIDGFVAGHLVVETLEDEVFLARIALLPDWQGRGIGSRIVRDVVRCARERDLPTVLNVLRENPRALALYERLGFRVVDSDELRHYLKIG